MADKVNIDWDELDKQNKSKFKNYADKGEYKVKIEGVGIRDVDTKNGTQYILSFKIKETEDTKWPDIDRWVFKSNEGFRRFHYRNLFMALGCSEDNAKAAVVECESAGDYDKIAEKYAKTLAQVANKYKRDVAVVVRDQIDQDGNYVINQKSGKPYTETEFLNFDDNSKHNIHFSQAKPKQAAPAVEEVPEDIPEGEEIDMDDIPF